MTINTKLNTASENNFRLIFPKLPHEDKVDRNLSLHIYETILPGVSFDASIQNWQAFQFPFNIETLKFENWSVSFDVDEKFDNWKRLFKWFTYINNNKDKAGMTIKNFVIDSNLLIYDNYDNMILKCVFSYMFPINLSGVTLTIRQGEQYLTSKIDLVYAYFQLQE